MNKIEIQGLEYGQNIGTEGNNLYLYIKGTHGDVQRIQINALYMFFKQFFTTDWQKEAAALSPQPKSKPAGGHDAK